MATKMQSLKSLAEVVSDAFDNKSFVVHPEKDFTGKYVTKAGHGGCFGAIAPTLEKMERSTNVHQCIIERHDRRS